MRSHLCGKPLLVLLVVCLITAPAAAGTRVIETPHYRIHSDLDLDLSEDLARRMEAMYDQYSRRFSAFITDQGPERFEVYLFAKKADYFRFTDERFPNTGGVFIPRRKILAAFLENQGRDGIRRTLQHEAFHQFAHSVIGSELPVWLNEGLAQVFEEGLWTGSQFIIGQVPPRRVRQLRQDMRERRLTEFKKFLSRSDAEWAEGLRDRARGAAQYNQSWAMAHFLIYATDENNGPRYRTRLIQMLKLIHDGTKADEAFATAFSDNVAGFQDRFVDYARDLEPTREATFIENQTVLADMLATLKNEGLTFEDVATFRKAVKAGQYRLQYERGPLRWNTAEDPGVYFMDSAGRMMDNDQLYFEPRRGAPLPDIVCRSVEKMQFHTRFYNADDRIEYEILIRGR